MSRSLLLSLLMIASLSASALAVAPGESLSDPALEARARTLSKELRCLVCQNQSIDDSDAELAADLRLVVRERLTAGDSDAEVLDYIVARYGDFVLLRPPFELATLLLWLGPFAVIFFGAAGLFIAFRRQASSESTQTLDLEEQKRVAQLLDEESQSR
ncbi:MAG: cytochrome c-type biogenesis protein CcmH [Parvibaculum sp.]|nr:cytochrome c-type biogenesis protein CcmH [Parvibaculum sp.]